MRFYFCLFTLQQRCMQQGFLFLYYWHQYRLFSFCFFSINKLACFIIRAFQQIGAHGNYATSRER